MSIITLKRCSHLETRKDFNSKKVIAVIINGKREIAPTWKSAFKSILLDAIKDNEKLSMMYNLQEQ